MTGIRKQELASIKANMSRDDGPTTYRPCGSDEYQVKKRDPSIMAHISAANIIPNGRLGPRPFSSCASLRAGNLKKIHKYIDPSKKQEVIHNAHKRLSFNMIR